jgi:hypothetical protein
VSRPVTPVEVRFWSQVEVRQPDECWPWTGFLMKNGYGQFKARPGELDIPSDYPRRSINRYAHRTAFFLVHGHWPEPFGLHGCDNRPCCNAQNPAHIHEGTQQQNLDEMVARGRSNKGARHWNARLTPEQIVAIKADPRSSPLAAPEYGVNARQARRIRQGVRW